MFIQLDQWPHFKESVKLFSIADLYNIATGDLMVQLKEIHEIYCNHITMTCHVRAIYYTIYALMCHVDTVCANCRGGIF